MPDQRVVAAAGRLLATADSTLCPSPAVAAALRQAGIGATDGDLGAAPDGRADAVALLDDELSLAGEHADGLLARAVDVLRPGGLLAVSVVSTTYARLTGTDAPVRTYRADEVRRLLGHHGLTVQMLCAPGAGGMLAGRPDADFDADTDVLPGLLDAGPRVVGVARAAGSMGERSATFFATLPYKIVAAAVICRDDDGRLLVVHDTFKRHWTIPGGVVDADENPRLAAEREAWEEAGVRVSAGRVAGVFSASWPDRVVLVYDAVLVGPRQRHEPLHAHEIDAVDWWPLDEALRRLAPHVAQQVRHCLQHPGGTLRQGRA